MSNSKELDDRVQAFANRVSSDSLDYMKFLGWPGEEKIAVYVRHEPRAVWYRIEGLVRDLFMIHAVTEAIHPLAAGFRMPNLKQTFGTLATGMEWFWGTIVPMRYDSPEGAGVWRINRMYHWRKRALEALGALRDREFIVARDVLLLLDGGTVRQAALVDAAFDAIAERDRAKSMEKVMTLLEILE